MNFNVKIESTDGKTGMKSRQVALRHIHQKEDPFKDLKRSDVRFHKSTIGAVTRIKVFIRGFEIGNLVGERYRPMFDSMDRDELVIGGINVKLDASGKYSLYISGTY